MPVAFLPIAVGLIEPFVGMVLPAVIISFQGWCDRSALHHLHRDEIDDTGQKRIGRAGRRARMGNTLRTMKADGNGRFLSPADIMFVNPVADELPELLDRPCCGMKPRTRAASLGLLNCWIRRVRKNFRRR